MTPSPFNLTANTLNEISLLMRPRDLVTKDMILNIVDTEQKKLVSSWLFVEHTTSPTVTKSFELSIPKGKSVNKVQITNDSLLIAYFFKACFLHKSIFSS